MIKNAGGLFVFIPTFIKTELAAKIFIENKMEKYRIGETIGLELLPSHKYPAYGG
ncbi:MAG: hypothetical protein ACUBOA_00380 [Candidatus Loosdrechtia sp.]|uniref:hypothetical protein n=1 Tax=Candidatus Loosdrechtia sp. TaxID=3101272 RepID=UPI003A71B07A|nr:MAG: hypothetical protein QY305_13435 [Candidatus Jettenia sp. AMX2]